MSPNPQGNNEDNKWWFTVAKALVVFVVSGGLIGWYSGILQIADSCEKRECSPIIQKILITIGARRYSFEIKNEEFLKGLKLFTIGNDEDNTTEIAIDNPYPEMYTLSFNIFDEKYNKYTKKISIDEQTVSKSQKIAIKEKDIKRIEILSLDLQKETSQKKNANDTYKDNIEIALDLSKQGEYEKSIPYFDRAIKLEKNHALAYHGRAGAYYFQQNYKQAVEDEDKAVNLDSDNSRYYTSRGMALNRLKEYNKALSDFNHALKLDPNNEDAKKGKAFAISKIEQIK